MNKGLAVIRKEVVLKDNVIHLMKDDEHHNTLCDTKYGNSELADPKEVFYVDDNELCDTCFDKVRELLTKGLADRIASISPLDI